MSDLGTVTRLGKALPVDRHAAGIWARVLLLEAFVLVAYFAVTTAEPTGEFRYLVYPFVWINLAGWAVLRTNPRAGSRRHALLAGGVAVTYFLAILSVPGVVGLGSAGSVDLRVAMQAPGWGPILALTSPWLRLYLVPFEVIGYAGLAYLVYANALATTRSAIPGVLGLVTCVGCTVPVLVPLVGLLGGPATGLTTTAYAWSYDIGTLVFAVTVGLLVWSHERAGSTERRPHPRGRRRRG